MQGWEHFQERAQWNAIPWDYPQVWSYSRGIRHARNPWKQKRQLTQPPNQPRKCTKHDKTSDNQTYTHASCWKEDGRNRKEECKAGNTSRREPSGMPGAPGGGAKSPIAAGDGSIWQNWENGEVREPNGYCSQPDEFDSRNHLCSQGLQRCRQYIYQVARCCYQCFHQKLFRNNCLAFDPSLDNYFHGVWPR